MTPLLVTAHLSSPPAVGSGPVMLDGVLWGALGAMVGASSPAGWADLADIEAVPLPLARVEGPGGLWWHACSQATPHGAESVTHSHRRAPLDMYARYCPNASTNVASGPDKSLRVPIYTRPSMRRMEWTCIGDAEEIARLLSHAVGVGRRTTHGFGRVERWTVTPLDGDPPDYAVDASARHLPVEHCDPPAGDYSRARLPLTPPYHDRGRALACWQVREVPHVC